jgi:hypothetical protein
MKKAGRYGLDVAPSHQNLHWNLVANVAVLGGGGFKRDCFSCEAGLVPVRMD